MVDSATRLHTEYFSMEQLAALLGVEHHKIDNILGSGRVRPYVIEGKCYLHRDQIPDLQLALDEE